MFRRSKTTLHMLALVPPSIDQSAYCFFRTIPAALRALKFCDKCTCNTHVLNTLQLASIGGEKYC